MAVFRSAKDRILDRLTATVVHRGAAQMAAELLRQPQVFGPPERLHVAKTAVVNNVLFNTISGDITVGEWGMIAHGACLLTGSHDVTKLNHERQVAAPFYDRDIRLGEGAWVATNAIVLGPCTIGDHAVVAAGAVVCHDVPPYAIVAGSPARVIGEVPH